VSTVRRSHYNYARKKGLGIESVVGLHAKRNRPVNRKVVYLVHDVFGNVHRVNGTATECVAEIKARAALTMIVWDVIAEER